MTRVASQHSLRKRSTRNEFAGSKQALHKLATTKRRHSSLCQSRCARTCEHCVCTCVRAYGLCKCARRLACLLAWLASWVAASSFSPTRGPGTLEAQGQAGQSQFLAARRLQLWRGTGDQKQGQLTQKKPTARTRSFPAVALPWTWSQVTAAQIRTRKLTWPRRAKLQGSCRSFSARAHGSSPFHMRSLLAPSSLAGVLELRPAGLPLAWL